MSSNGKESTSNERNSDGNLTNKNMNRGRNGNGVSNGNGVQKSNDKKWYQKKLVLWLFGLVGTFVVAAAVFAPKGEDGEAPTMKDRLIQGLIFSGIYVFITLLLLARVNVFLLHLFSS